jgi:hypothetical protein
MVGTYEIRNYIFNIHMRSNGFGLWDNWRYDHPENPDWMKIFGSWYGEYDPNYRN